MVDQLLRAIEIFRDLDQDMPSQAISTFLYVAKNEGCSQGDLIRALGTSQAGISRNLAALDKVNRHNQPGLGLVRAIPDPTDMRRKLIKLTDRGRHVRDRLAAIGKGQ